MTHKNNIYSANLISTQQRRKAQHMAIMLNTERMNGNTLTVDDLTRAIKNSIDREGLKDEEAREMAQHVLNFFGYSDMIIDNILEPDDRDAFYMLEDSGLLTTQREETTLYDGREWRIHYWLFRRNKIMELANMERHERGVISLANPETSSVYDDVPEDIWSMPKTNVLIERGNGRKKKSPKKK